MEALGALLVTDMASLLKKCIARPDMFAEYLAAQKRLPEIHDRIGKLEIQRDTIDRLIEWWDGPRKLESAKNSAIHRFNETVKLHFDDKEITHDFHTLEADKFHCFVIEHNLAAAFAPVEGFAEGEVQLPYNDMIFEFQVSGKRVMFLIVNADQVDPNIGRLGMIYVEFDRAWAAAAAPLKMMDNGTWQLAGDGDIFSALVEFLWPQVRAACIALEAGIVTEQVIRAPYALNRSREKLGKPPLMDYSVIQLLHRKRYQPLDGQPAPHGRHRFHFVRGHWRHYEAHKTWVKWHMRGDIDLGIVEKEYRL